MKTWLLTAFMIASLAATGCSVEAEGTEEQIDDLAASVQGPYGSVVPGAWCQPIPACDAPPPRTAPRSRWRHFGSALITATGWPSHRGRDLLVNPGDPQWVIAKLSYGLFDKDLKDELVDIYALRGCGDAWELLGTATTTQDDEHPTAEGVDDSGGRVYFQIPPEKALGLGRHRIRLVVRGDLSSTELFIEVVPPGTPLFVSDVDGTLTTQETEEFTAMLFGVLPGVNGGAPEAFRILAEKGYHPMYLTARPEWLVQRTRDFLGRYGFPPGVVHTTLGLTGATGTSAAHFKTGELDALADREIAPEWAFGNTSTDAEAYASAGISGEQRVFHRFSDTTFGGRRIESYTQLLDELRALPSLCE